MNLTMFEPSPVLLGFIFFKKFIYLQLLALLALPRVVLARGATQTLALAVVLIGTAATFIVLAPSLALNNGQLYATGAQALAHWGGMTVPVLSSGLLALSAALPDKRAPWVDRLHLMALGALLGLWLASQY